MAELDCPHCKKPVEFQHTYAISDTRLVMLEMNCPHCGEPFWVDHDCCSDGYCMEVLQKKGDESIW